MPIRTMCETDLTAVVAVHLQAFPGFFLSFLGAGFLAELYHGVLEDPAGITLVSERDGQVEAFIAGTSEPCGFYRRLLARRGWRFVLASLRPLLRRPYILGRLWRALAKSSGWISCSLCMPTNSSLASPPSNRMPMELMKTSFPS